MSATRQTTRHYPSEFERRRAWPVGLVAGLLAMTVASDLVCLWAGTQFGIAMERERAPIQEAAKPKATSVRTNPPLFISDCSKRALQEIRTACYLRAQSELTRQSERAP